MRDAVGSTWVYSIVIVFTLIFSGFMVLVLAYSRAYKIKNEVTSIIEKYEGVTSSSLELINNYLKNSAYTAEGDCTNYDYGYVIDEDKLENVNSQKKYNICFSLSNKNSNGKYHVNVQLFYHFNVPVLGSISDNKVGGQTNTMKCVYLPENDLHCS